MRARRCSLWILLLGALALCFAPGVAEAQTSGGGIGSASSAAGRYVDPGMNAGSTVGATSGVGTTFSGGFSASTGITGTSGSTGTTGGDGDGGGGWPAFLLPGFAVLLFLLYVAGKVVESVGRWRERRW